MKEPTPVKHKEFGDALRRFADQAGISQVEVSKSMSVTPQAVSSWFRGVHLPGHRHMRQLSQLLGISIDDLLAAAGSGKTAPKSANQDNIIHLTRAIPSDAEPVEAHQPWLGRPDLPVYASAEGGDGEVIVTYEPIDFIARPAPLEKVRDAFAVYAVNDSMAPRFESGDLLLVNPSKPVKPGHDVLLVISSDGISHSMLVKRLVRRTQESVIVQQYNPAGEITIPAERVIQIMRVVGTYTD